MANSKQIISDDMMKFVTFWATMTLPGYEIDDLPEIATTRKIRKPKKQIVEIEEVSDGKL